jgi:hypothetical protein
MEIKTQQNRTDVVLSSDESFFVKPALLKGFVNYDWTFPPPFPFGSPILRLIHRCWIFKQVQGNTIIPILGNYPRGNFTVVKLAEGERFFISARHLAGFSGSIRKIKTKIKFSPAFWLFHHHFYTIIEGPGEVLIYGAADFEISKEREFQPSRVVAFKVDKKFRPVAPQPKTVISRVINILFSHEVIWQFQESGNVIAETCTEVWGSPRGSGLKRFLKHLLGFLRI